MKKSIQIIPLFNDKMIFYVEFKILENFDLLEEMKYHNINFNHNKQISNGIDEFLIEFHDQSDMILFKLIFSNNIDKEWLNCSISNFDNFEHLRTYILTKFDKKIENIR